MKLLHELEAKYAAGGPVGRSQFVRQQLAAVRTAIKHIENGKHKEAANALQSSPAAMSHPQIAGIAKAINGTSATPDAAAPPAMAGGGSVADARAVSEGSAPASIMGSLTSAINSNPNASAMLKGHAMALLRAHLNAARALHQLTGDQSGFQSLMHQAGQMKDPMAMMTIMQEMGQGAPPPGGGPSPQVVAPMAMQAAQNAAGPPQ